MEIRLGSRENRYKMEIFSLIRSKLNEDMLVFETKKQIKFLTVN